MSLKWKTVWIAGNVRGNVLLNLIRHRAVAIVLIVCNVQMFATKNQSSL